MRRLQAEVIMGTSPIRVTQEQFNQMKAEAVKLGFSDDKIHQILIRRVTVMSTSWLKKVGHVFGSVLRFVANEEPKIAAIAAPALELAFPQFAPLIAAGDALATKITKQIVLTETLSASVTTAKTGIEKANAALAAVGPEIDAWVAAAFPGSKTLSDPGKRALIDAFVKVANEVEADFLPLPAAPPVV